MSLEVVNGEYAFVGMPLQLFEIKELPKQWSTMVKDWKCYNQNKSVTNENKWDIALWIMENVKAYPIESSDVIKYIESTI